MKKAFFVLASILLISLAFVLGSKFTQASEIGRAYFRIKNEGGLAKVAPYLHHDFGDGVFSIEAPKVVIEALAKSKLLEFRGEASLWEISSHREISASCSPSSQIPWGVAKVKGGTGGSSLKVAVIDTGVKSDHPDLINNLVDCKDAQSFVLRNRCKDGNGHGTHVAGTILANGKIKGVAPDAKLMAIKVCSDSGFCWSDDVARGIRYAADNGANIISISLGGSSLAQDEQLALDYAIDTKGALVVAAAGNSGPGDNSIGYPAAYYKVVAAGATDSQDAIASWSSRGNNFTTTPYLVEERDIEFAAPGVAVESTWKDGCYKTISGTSMATPHVSGLAAKVWQGSAQTTRTFLQDRAKNFYTDIGRSGDDPDAGWGLPTSP